MRLSLFLVFAALTLSGFAQRKLMIGQVLDKNKENILGVHVVNQTAGKITVSNQRGEFNLPVNIGDTLLLTSMGFKDLMVIVGPEYIEGRISLIMVEGSIELREVTISSIPSIDIFKKRILATQVKDPVQFWYFGVPPPVFKGDQMVESNKRKSVLYAITSPTNFLYYNLSKQEKEKRKYAQVQKQQPEAQAAQAKFTREWIHEQTGLEEDELTIFIAYCSYTTAYLIKTPLYIIREDMLEKLAAFKKQS